MNYKGFNIVQVIEDKRFYIIGTDYSSKYLFECKEHIRFKLA